MGPAKHCRLGASGAARWINCPGSVALCAGLPDEGSPYAAEGTRVHELCAALLAQAAAGGPACALHGAEGYSAEEIDCAEGYAAYAVSKAQGAKVLIEQRVDYSDALGVPGCFGTADCLILAPGALTVIDYKHGQGVRVDAHENPQLSLYALGAIHLFDALYGFEDVRLCVYQPRIANVSEYETTADALRKRAQAEFAPAARAAAGRSGALKCGEWCRFCRARNLCRARAEAQLALAREDFARPPLMDDGEVAALLPRLDGIIRWAQDLKEYALHAAVSGGRQWPGYKLVHGRSARRYADEEAVAAAVRAAGFDPYEHRILGVTAMTKLLGRKRFDELAGPHLVRDEGKPTLVPDSDPRPAFNDPAADFGAGKR